MRDPAQHFSRSWHRLGRGVLCLLILVLGALPAWAAEAPPPPTLATRLDALSAAHPGLSGAVVLEKGEEALLARAWLADHAAASIDIQYFIWSTDNIGILAAEALLRAAERGVRVRVIVDDLLVDAPPESLVALAAHPSIAIRIYNPLHSVGVGTLRRLRNVAFDLRGANQRMHDKTFLVDGRAAITGGRNLADEYFDYDHAYNFRDRDILLLGPVLKTMEESFERFWNDPLSVPVERLLADRKAGLSPERIAAIYRELHAYAADPANFAPAVRAALERFPERFPALVEGLAWGEVRFLCDRPGKNDGSSGLGGGGATTEALAAVVRGARQRVTIQSPYLILPDGALDLFRELIAKGVRVRISTNSLASTDNLQAFSGYLKQRRALLAAGIEIHEFRPRPAIMHTLIERYRALEKEAPVFAIHAKTLVVDGATLFVGTFNLDPRSANLNTEVGVLLTDPRLAAQVEANIERDMAPENSWNPAVDRPDRQAEAAKRLRVRFWQALPLQPLL